MTKNEKPVLRLTIRGPGVKRGRIAVPDLVRICQEAQVAVKRQAEALEGRKTMHPGPVSGPIQEECILELIAIGKGSTKLDFSFAKPQTRFPGVQAVGTSAISELAMSIRSLGNGNKRNIDPGVLESVYRLSSVAQSGGISSLDWLAIPTAPGRAPMLAQINAVVRERAAQRLSATHCCPATVDGVLDPSLALAQRDFYVGTSLLKLAEMQKVNPLRNPPVLAGAIPADQDVDEFLEAIYSGRK